jgi:hypothetical protein
LILEMRGLVGFNALETLWLITARGLNEGIQTDALR